MTGRAFFCALVVTGCAVDPAQDSFVPATARTIEPPTLAAPSRQLRPWDSPETLRAYVRDLGQTLAGKWYESTTLSAWRDGLAELGVEFWYGGILEPAANSKAKLWLGNHYDVSWNDVSAEGWRARNRVIDTEGWQPDMPLEAKDRDGVFITARHPDIVWIGPDGWTRTLPTGTALAGGVLAVSPGSGRLISVDMRPEGRIQVLPQAFEDEVAPAGHSMWPFVDRASFAHRLRDMGRSLEAAEDQHVLSAWHTYTSLMGFVLRPRPAALEQESSNRTSSLSKPVDSVFPLFWSWTVAREDISPAGWRIRNVAFDLRRSEAGLTQIAPEGFLLSADEPRVVALSEYERLDPVPSGEQLEGVRLIVVPGNGTLLQIDMGAARPVSISPFP